MKVCAKFYANNSLDVQKRSRDITKYVKNRHGAHDIKANVKRLRHGNILP
jgi:hypothetical protein